MDVFYHLFKILLLGYYPNRFHETPLRRPFYGERRAVGIPPSLLLQVRLVPIRLVYGLTVNLLENHS